MGLGNQDSCPWRQCKTDGIMEFQRLLSMNWEASTVPLDQRRVVHYKMLDKYLK
jgi:hypothetical protein